MFSCSIPQLSHKTFKLFIHHKRNHDVTDEFSAVESMLIFHICCCLSIVQTSMLIKLSCFPGIFSSLNDIGKRNSLILPMANANKAIASPINSDAVTRIIFRHKQKYLSSAERANLQCSGRPSDDSCDCFFMRFRIWRTRTAAGLVRPSKFILASFCAETHRRNYNVHDDAVGGGVESKIKMTKAHKFI